MERITIAQPKIEDARESIEVQYQAWLNTYPNEKFGITVDDIKDRYKNAFEGRRLEAREKLISNLEPNEKFLIAKDGEKVIGICYGILENDLNKLQAVYILPEYQGKGVGTMFWKEISKFFNKGKDVIVEVVNYNEKAIGFYKKLGFVDTGKRIQEERFRMKSGSIFQEIEMKLDKELLK